jgi:hypothetical protein
MAEHARESPRIDTRHVLIAAGAIGASVVIAVAVAWIFIAAQGGTVSAVHAPPPQLQPPPEPRPLQDLAAFRAEEAAKTSRYAWIDERAGVVQIPVSRAMDLLVERNARAEARAAAPDPPAARGVPAAQVVR